MARVIDPISATQDDIKQLTDSLDEALAASGDDNVSKQTPATGDDDGLPDKLKGKSAAEIAQMYQNLQSAYGRMANELGSNRKVLDEVLSLKRQTDLGLETRTPEVNVTQEDLLERPTETIKKVLEADQTRRQAPVMERLDNLERQIVQRDFNRRHPDAMSLANDQKFLEFVQASPTRVRSARAGLDGDLEALSDVLDEYKTHRDGQTKKLQEQGQQGRQAAAAASLESGGQQPSATAQKGKIYSRVALQRLRRTNRELYYSAEYQAEIRKAYADGRVR